jgi:hypothetical protein
VTVVPTATRRAIAVGVLVSVLAAPTVAVKADHSASDRVSTSAVVLEWYDLTQQTVAAAAFPEQATQGRTWAVSWLAAARAVGRRGDARHAVAAFATALHDTLVAEVPSQRSRLDAALATTLATIPDSTAKQRGIAAGAAQAAATLAARDGDGLDTASVNRPWSPPPPGPGIWQPTPPTFAPAVRAGLPDARAFLLTSNDQFRPGPPPALDSPTYLDALTEVRTIGSATSSVRTPHQLDVAGFWEQSSTAAYGQVLRAVIAQSHRSLAWQTRLVAGFHAITIDAQIAIHDAKYAYVFWRPVTAIRTSGTGSDPTWAPLTATPRHPEYPSGHTGYAGAAEEILETLVGPRPREPIAVTSTTAPGVTHVFTRWSTITQENIDGRVWEGVHFRFSDEIGADVGRRVARHDLRFLRQLFEATS